MNRRNSTEWLRLDRVSKDYGIPRHAGSREESSLNIQVLRNITVSVTQGEFAALMGPSGCGKSTLLNLVAGIDRPTSGEIHIGDTCISSATETALIRARREDLGVIYQFFHLLPTLTAHENVILPLILKGDPSAEAARKARRMLERVKMTHRADHRPAELSGGELQRVALARAVVHEPKLLLADEPTGNLDTQTGDELMTYIRSLTKDGAMTVLLATHSVEVAVQADRTIYLRDGTVVEDESPLAVNQKPGTGKALS